MPFVDPNEMWSRSPLPGWSGRFFHSQHVTIGHWDVASDAADLHEHQHPQEEIWNVVDGEVLLRIDGQERLLGPGTAAVIPANTPHSATVRTACRAIIVDYPIRPELPGSAHPGDVAA